MQLSLPLKAWLLFGIYWYLRAFCLSSLSPVAAAFAAPQKNTKSKCNCCCTKIVTISATWQRNWKKKENKKKIPKLAKCPRKANEMCSRIHKFVGAQLPGCTLHQQQVRVRFGILGYRLGFALVFFLFCFLRFEYCRKRPTNNHLQAAKLHNRPGRISIFFFLCFFGVLLGVIVAIICSKSDTHTQAGARTAGAGTGSCSCSPHTNTHTHREKEIRYHKAQGSSRLLQASPRCFLQPSIVAGL